MTIAINFISSREIDKECVMHSKSNNIEIMTNDKTDEVIEENFELLLSRYHIGLEALIEGSGFVFDCVYLLYRKRH